MEGHERKPLLAQTAPQTDPRTANGDARSPPQERKITGRVAQLIALVCIVRVIYIINISIVEPILHWKDQWWTLAATDDSVIRPLIPFPTCPNSRFSKQATYRFNDTSNFLIREAFLTHGLKSKIHFAAGRANQTDPIVVAVKSDFNDPRDYNRLQQTVHSDTQWNSFIIREFVSENNTLQDCIATSIMVYIRSDFRLEDLVVQNSGADVEIGHDAEFTAKYAIFENAFSSTKIAWASAFDPQAGRGVAFQHTVMNYFRGDVMGEWILDASMRIRIDSGEVDIGLNLHGGTEAIGRPAALSIDAGRMERVSVRMPDQHIDLPARDFSATISVVRGDISGQLTHTSQTKLVTKKGSIDVVMVPHDVGYGLPSSIQTESTNVETRIIVREPIKQLEHSSPILSRTSSSHIVVPPDASDSSWKGSLDLQYPLTWSGHIDGTVANGTLALDMVDAARCSVPKSTLQNSLERVACDKGHGESQLIFFIQQGDAHLSIRP